MKNVEHTVEDGLRVAYFTHEDGSVHRYEETAELDEMGLQVFDYTGEVRHAEEAQGQGSAGA